MSDDKKNFELFDGKTLSNLFEDIYKNSENTGTQVGGLVNQLKTFVTSLDTAVVIVPLIREYLDVKVKSDEQLVKLSDTIQRLLRNEKTQETSGISEEEKKQLLEDVPTYEERRIQEQQRIEKLNNEVSKITTELEQKAEKAKEREVN